MDSALLIARTVENYRLASQMKKATTMAVEKTIVTEPTARRLISEGNVWKCGSKIEKYFDLKTRSQSAGGLLYLRVTKSRGF